MRCVDRRGFRRRCCSDPIFGALDGNQKIHLRFDDFIVKFYCRFFVLSPSSPLHKTPSLARCQTEKNIRRIQLAALLEQRVKEKNMGNSSQDKHCIHRGARFYFLKGALTFGSESPVQAHQQYNITRWHRVVAWVHPPRWTVETKPKGTGVTL